MGQAKRTSRVLIAGENLLFRRGLSALFANDPAFNVIGEGTDAGSVLSQLRDLRPNVLVIDAALLEGGEAAPLGRAIRQAYPGLLTLVLASRDTGQDIAAAISVGAKGFMLKGSTPAKLIAALHKVAFQEGGMNLSGLLPEFQALSTQMPVRSYASMLTAREQEVIKLLAEGKTVRSISKDLSLSMKTVDAHKLNLMRKLDIHDRASLVAYANRSGLVPSMSHA